MPKSVPNPPFVNFGVLDKTDAFDNRRVRMVCSILTYDQRSAKVKTTDQEEVIVIFLEKLREDFRLIADYYLFEGAAKEQGALLFVEKEPEPLLYPRTFDGTEDEISKLFAAKKVKTVWSVMDDMTTFMHERPWLKSGGGYLPRPQICACRQVRTRKLAEGRSDFSGINLALFDHTKTTYVVDNETRVASDALEDAVTKPACKEAKHGVLKINQASPLNDHPGRTRPG
ncbi:hypothetical protein NP233_g8184 [Leucocoprinus birnbaumii]|uniref:Uncharacterized protein n=1 Tax=Leucocoprinus birnbaumii TaxID=56174 RepID=A0AAD5VMR3_9AGAR|nr:hypothetical protein NP233_g8184 [Leucocoprinus birnbaumii]